MTTVQEKIEAIRRDFYNRMLFVKNCRSFVKAAKNNNTQNKLSYACNRVRFIHKNQARDKVKFGHDITETKKNRPT